MRFRKEGHSGTEFDLSIEEVAALYGASPWATTSLPLGTKLRAFVSDPAGPVNATWHDEEDDYLRLMVMILHQDRSIEAMHRPPKMATAVPSSVVSPGGDLEERRGRRVSGQMVGNRKPDADG